MSGPANCYRESSGLWRLKRQLPAWGLLIRLQPCSAVPQATECHLQAVFQQKLSCGGAGSERVGKSEATGDRLEEAKHINKSLSALGQLHLLMPLKQDAGSTLCMHLSSVERALQHNSWPVLAAHSHTRQQLSARQVAASTHNPKVAKSFVA